MHLVDKKNGNHEKLTGNLVTGETLFQKRKLFKIDNLSNGGRKSAGEKNNEKNARDTNAAKNRKKGGHKNHVSTPLQPSRPSHLWPLCSSMATALPTHQETPEGGRRESHKRDGWAEGTFEWRRLPQNAIVFHEHDSKSQTKKWGTQPCQK